MQVLESGKLAAGKKHAGRDCGDDGGVHHAVQAMASVAAVTLDSPLDDDGSMSSGTQVESVDEAYIATHVGTQEASDGAVETLAAMPQERLDSMRQGIAAEAARSAVFASLETAIKMHRLG